MISPNNKGWTAEYVFNTNDASALQHFNSAEADDFNANWLALLNSKMAVWNVSPGYWRYGSTVFQSNTWYHIALVRSGNDYTIRKNGTTVKAFTDASALPSLAAVLKIGAKEFVATNDYAGYLDNIRITKGTALWTANFNLNDAELFYAHKETHTIAIASADTYQAESWDISGVADADKDAIDHLQMKVLNAGSARDFYIDNVRAE